MEKWEVWEICQILQKDEVLCDISSESLQKLETMQAMVFKSLFVSSFSTISILISKYFPGCSGILTCV